MTLLDAVRHDMGEEGTERDGLVFFVGACPICGRRNCATVDKAADTLSCSNTGRVHALATYRTSAVPVPPEPFEAGYADSYVQSPRLPPPDAVRATDPPKRSPELISGILRRGHVALLSGKGKSGKSWSAIALSIAVATGGIWFGHRCKQGRVLFVDPELDPRSLHNRFAKVADALGVDAARVDASVMKWSLRGVPYASIENMVHDLEILQEKFDIVVIDSCSYFVSGDENSAVDIRRFAGQVLRLAAVTGASVLLVHHMGKGNAGDRDVGERARGSSVWLDFPDAPLALTEVFPPSGEPSDYLEDGERAFVFEDAGLLEFPSFAPVHLILRHPVHVADQDGITDGWKPKSGQKTGGNTTAAVNKARSADRAARCETALAAEFMARGIGSEGMGATEAADACAERMGEPVNAQTLKKYVEQSDLFEVLQTSARRWKVAAKEPPRDPPQRLGFEPTN